MNSNWSAKKKSYKSRYHFRRYKSCKFNPRPSFYQIKSRIYIQIKFKLSLSYPCTHEFLKFVKIYATSTVKRQKKERTRPRKEAAAAARKKRWRRQSRQFDPLFDYLLEWQFLTKSSKTRFQKKPPNFFFFAFWFNCKMQKGENVNLVPFVVWMNFQQERRIKAYYVWQKLKTHEELDATIITGRE